MRTRRTGIVLGCVVVLAAALVTAWTLRGGGHRPAPAAVAGSSSAPVPTVSAAAPATTASPDPLRAVAAAVPSAFVMQGPAFTIRANVCAMPYVRPLDPPGEQHHTVCWVQHPFGVEPGYPSSGTSYILGHAWAHDRDEVLNPMSELAMAQVDLATPTYEDGVPIFPVTALDGYAVSLATPTGTLTYRVARAFAVAKARAGDVPSVMADTTPDRIVIITCGVRDTDGSLVDVDVNVIAYATLVSAVPA